MSSEKTQFGDLDGQVACLTADERQRHVSESRGGGEGDQEEVDTSCHILQITPNYQVDILPHEQKLLNWCVHDFLVRQGYRISAITFSDECSEQVKAIKKILR